MSTWHFLEPSDLDFQRWDAMVEQDVGALPYNLSWYLEVCMKNNWCAYVLDDYKVGLALPYKQIGPFGFARQGYGIQKMQLFGDLKNLDSSCFKELFANINSRNIYMDIHLDYPFDVPVTIGKSEQIPNYELELSPSYADLQKSYSQNLKRNIKKAQSLTISKTNEYEKMILDQFSSYAIKQHGVSPKYIDTMHLLLQKCSKNGKVESWFVESESHLLGGAIFLKYHSKLILMVLSRNIDDEMPSVSHVLVDSLIQQYAGKNWVLDFEGSKNDGIARFYASFGAKSIPYLRIKKLIL